jgi:hypothetical protein
MRSHPGAVVVNEGGDLEIAPVTSLMEVNPDLSGAPLNGIIYVLAQGRCGAGVAKIAERIHQSLPQEERHFGPVFQNPVKNGSPASWSTSSPLHSEF